MFKYMPLGDGAFLIKLGNSISKDINRQIYALVLEINKCKIRGVIELIPAYNELTIIYNPQELKFNVLLDRLKEIEKKVNTKDQQDSLLIHIPVCYDREFAPDLEMVADANNLTLKDVIQIHSETEYLVYMLGFTPGFCYLGGLNEKITTPRKESPKQIIDAGSVGIAGNQTGIYPIDSPGGWQIIGKTPLKLFDPERKPEFLIDAGNFIKFDPISKKEFEIIKLRVDSGNYELKKDSMHV